MTSVSGASSVSGHTKLLSPQNHTDNRSKSCDTNCTSNSSCFFKRRKPMNPLAYSVRPTYNKTNNPVKQRVMSAKLLKVRQLQSQLNDANYHLAEVARENQVLRTLQKRQDKALSKYENTNADLPRLIHSHEEEIRVLNDKNKNLRKSVKDLTDQLKLREEELGKVREQLTHLERLNKDKHLTEREKLTDKMEEYRMKLQKSEEQITTLNRKLMLENKTSTQRLNTEIAKHKQCQKELWHAFDEIDRLTGLLDAKENIARPRNPRFNKLQSRDSTSTASLRYYQSVQRNISNEKLNSQVPITEIRLEPISNGKETENGFRKYQNGFKTPMENIRQRLSSGSIKTPQDFSNINSDVSTESRDNSAGSFKSRPNSSVKLEKLPSVQECQKVKVKEKQEGKHKEDLKDINDDDRSNEEVLVEKNVFLKYDYERDGVIKLPTRNHRDIDRKSDESEGEDDKNASRPLPEKSSHEESGNSSEEDVLKVLEKLKKVKKEEEKTLYRGNGDNTNNNNTVKKETFKSNEREEDIEKMAEKLDETIQKVAQNSKKEFDKNLSSYCSDVLNSVKSCGKVIEIHKESLENSKQDTNALLDTLKETEKVENQLKKSFFNMDDDMDFVHEILNEEHKFQMENKVTKSLTRDKNSNIEKKSLVNLESKKKLLATLRAIDNGDSVESIEEPNKEGSIIKEIFGNIAH